MVSNQAILEHGDTRAQDAANDSGSEWVREGAGRMHEMWPVTGLVWCVVWASPNAGKRHGTQAMAPGA